MPGAAFAAVFLQISTHFTRCTEFYPSLRDGLPVSDAVPVGQSFTSDLTDRLRALPP